MKIALLVASLLIAVASTAAAQNAAPTDKFQFNMVAGSLAEANSYKYELELDGVVQATPLAVTCVDPSPYTCKAPIPAITPSTHTARVRAVDISGTPIVGPFSDLLTFTMRATPAKPTGLTIVPGEAGVAGLLFDLGAVPTPEQ